MADEPTPDRPDPEPAPTNLPTWVVLEVGRLHLDNLALRRELEDRDRQA